MEISLATMILKEGRQMNEQRLWVLNKELDRM